MLWIATAAMLFCTGSAHQDIEAFQGALERLAENNNLPGYSAAIVRDQELAWAVGFGYADLENGEAAGPDTPYRLASVSKPFAAVILLQLVEEKKLDLGALMRSFAILPWFEPGGGDWAHYPARYAAQPITVRHVLSHTSQSDPPGDSYRYNGNIFGDLTWVIEDVTKSSYPQVLLERILQPLHMTRSLPGQLAPWGQDVARAIARPYRLSGGKPVPAAYPGFGLDPDVDAKPWGLDPAYRLPRETQESRRKLLGQAFTPLYSGQTASGVISTVRDLAKFDIALDRNRLIGERSREELFTAARSSTGEVLPYGLGWFVEEWNGNRLVWHYGWFPPTVSALYLKVPDRNLTFLLLSNCDGLSAGMPWTARGVRASPYARLFLDHFVYPKR
jgi:CubicO group peptidase (beta-lactamase class C family)